MALSPMMAQEEDSAARSEGRVAYCPDDPCPCRGYYSAIQVYYFGTETVDINVYKDMARTTLLASFSGVTEGQLLTIDGTSSATGTLEARTYFFVEDATGETCMTKIHTTCPTLGWPISTEDLKILGKTFGDFTVFSRTDSDSNYECDISNVAQDWHVGGNIIGPSNNTLGTRNNENLVFITHDVARGTITKTGSFGINTLSPAARLDVQGDVLIDETLDVNGNTTIHSLAPGLSPADAALVVAGGAGIGHDIYIGNDANITNNAAVGNDLAVVRDAAVGRDLAVTNNATIGNDANVGNDLAVNRDALIGRNLQVSVDATIINDLDVGNDVAVGNDLAVANNALVGNDMNVNRNAQIGRNINVTDNATIGQDLDVNNNATVGNDLSVNNNANITNNIQVGQSATVGQNLTVGNDATIASDLDVSGDAHIDGVVTIGTVNTPGILGTVNTGSFQLFVDGGILTEEVLVRTGWADYVFEADYKRPTLEEVEKHIATHGHLPNTPSAKEVSENGLSLGNTAVNQQEKIEELFLYIIEMNKEIKTLQEENKTLIMELQLNK